MRSLRGGVLAAMVLFAGAETGAAANNAVRAPQIVAAIDDAHRVELVGNVRPEARPRNDRGAVPETLRLNHILLQLKRSASADQALQRFITRLSDRTSPDYRHWITPQQFGARFGVEDSDIQKITGWLALHGFQVTRVMPGHMLVDFSGTAGQVRDTFHSEIHYLDVKGQRHLANISNPQIPVALAPAIGGISSLSDFWPHTNFMPRAKYTFGGCKGSCYAVVPADLATIYNLKPLFNAGFAGQGQTIAVIEDSDVYSAADWSTFRTTFGLSSFNTGSFSQVHPNCGDPGIGGNDEEATLDAEYATAAAPGAAIVLASCPDDYPTFGGLVALESLINSAPPPGVISISYGECEAYDGAAANATYYAAYQQAITEGVSIFVSSGDEGAAGCDADAMAATHGIGVNAMASTPFNVAVGGTDFGDTYARQNATYWNTTNSSVYGSAKSYIPEIPWNNSCASTLSAAYNSGSALTYGSSGFCNSAQGEKYFLTTASGSGGPSACATGTPSTYGVVSGSCAGYAKPSWQSNVAGIPGDGTRDLPDVSLFAANGLWSHYFIVCFSDPYNGGHPCSGAPSGWSGGGGTSFSAPILAAIQSLVDQYIGAPQGNPNPVYYYLAGLEYGANGNAGCNSSNGNKVNASCVFYDTTAGDMDVNCVGSNNCYLPSGANGVLSTSSSSYNASYSTATGWDFATGLGSVNAANLAAAWP
ncbi:MAG TPA: protease pro-enzyme activation domain-containing protein [Rhizomicrobium sp.]|jgi:subtilase family serine protease